MHACVCVCVGLFMGANLCVWGKGTPPQLLTSISFPRKRAPPWSTLRRSFLSFLTPWDNLSHCSPKLLPFLSPTQPVSSPFSATFPVTVIKYLTNQFKDGRTCFGSQLEEQAIMVRKPWQQKLEAAVWEAESAGCLYSVSFPLYAPGFQPWGWGYAQLKGVRESSHCS